MSPEHRTPYILTLAVLWACHTGSALEHNLGAVEIWKTQTFTIRDWVHDLREPEIIMITSVLMSMVECQLITSPSFKSCNSTDIRVYSGASAEQRLLVGSYCGPQSQTFQTSDNVMTIVINVANIHVNFDIKVTYKARRDCQVELDAQTFPKYLRTPNYRNTLYGPSFSLLGCRWTLSTSTSRQLRLSFSYASWYNQSCLSNITMVESKSRSCLTDLALSCTFPLRQKFATWCGGEDHVFVSSYSHVQIIIDGGLMLPPVEVQVQAQTEKCYHERTVKKGAGDYIRFYSNLDILSDMIVCKWRIMAFPPHSALLRINVTMSDLVDTPGCSKDIVMIYDATGSQSSVALSWCGNQTPVIELFTSALIIEYQKGNNHSEVYAGFELFYQNAEEPLCSESLTSHRSKQRLTSPDYPKPFRSYAKCIWKITSTAPENVIKLNVINTNVEDGHRPLCNRSRIAVYDGHNEERSKLIKEWCQDEALYLQSKSQHLLVIFISENNYRTARTGFDMVYYEGQYREDVVATVFETSVTFPGNSLNYNSGYNAQWSIRNPLTFHHIAVRFTHVDLHCPSDVITLYDGGANSPHRSFTFCGKSDRSLLSLTDHLEIVFKTRTNLGKGFTMVYKLLYYQGCFKGIKEVDVEESVSHVTSPGFTYFDNMACSWRFFATTPRSRIRMSIQTFNIVTSTSPVCSSDYIRLYDGHDTASMKLEPAICGKNQLRNVESTSRYLYMVFYTDHVNTARGFSVTYYSFLSDYDKEAISSPFPTGIVLGVAIGMVLIVAVCVIVNMCARRRRALRRNNRNNPPQASSRICSVQYTSPSHGDPSLNFLSAPPPSYSEVGNLPPGVKNDDIPPPSYSEAMAAGMIQTAPCARPENEPGVHHVGQLR